MHQDRLDILKALQKAYDVLEKEEMEFDDEESEPSLAERIGQAIGLNENMNIQTVPKPINRPTRRAWSAELRNTPLRDPSQNIRTAQNYLKKNVPGWEARHLKQQSDQRGQADVEQMRQQWYAQHPGQQPVEEKDYVKEFGESQKDKKIPVKFEPPSEWGFDPGIQHIPTKKQVPYVDKTGKQKRVPWVKRIKEDELEEMVTEAVLDMMNTMDTPPFSSELLEEQKQEIQKKIEEYCKRPGIMSISFREDINKDEAIVNALIDPTNQNNWIFLKEEVIYKLPYSYKDALYDFAKEVWNRDKGI